jgi:Leucine-rich repeat (LRR) protein
MNNNHQKKSTVMKKYIILLAIAAFSFASCSKDDKTPLEEEIAVKNTVNAPAVIHARTETNTQAETKTMWGEDLKVLWNANDRITVFNQNQNATIYRFKGSDGDAEGDFEIVGGGGGTALFNYAYAVYPHSNSTTISEDGSEISFVLPATQTYKANCFGLEANTMVAARGPISDSDMNFEFKNVCGYLRLKLYGDDVKVSSITLQGILNEKIAGNATITQAVGGLPSVTMGSDAGSMIKITCPTPVTLGSTAETATEFNFVIPPVSFSNGFKIFIEGVSGESNGQAVKSTSSTVTISRNVRRNMAALKVALEPVRFINFDDANFKAFCVAHYDQDGDGEISFAEAKIPTVMDISEKEISSIAGIEYFINLTELNCNKNNLKSVDLSANTKLKYLSLDENQLTSIDVSHNTLLQGLNVSNNELSSLDISSNPYLQYVNAWENKITTFTSHARNTELTSLRLDDNLLNSLDVSNLINLESLNCSNNSLSSLNLLSNTNLNYLECANNNLASLDLHKNTKLTDLRCNDNGLNTLNLSSNPKISILNCSNNNLTSLDLATHTDLSYVNIHGNDIASLNVGNSAGLAVLVAWPQKNGYTFAKLTKDKDANILYQRVEGESYIKIDDPRVSPYNTTIIEADNTLVEFDDETFEMFCVFNYDVNGDEKISIAEIADVQELDISNQGIKSLKGIECFSSLFKFDCSGNDLTDVDLRTNPNLTKLFISNNRYLKTLNLNASLENPGNLVTLDVSNNPSLEVLYLNYQPLSTIDVSGCANLKRLDCDYNTSLSGLDLSGHESLEWLSANGCSSLATLNLNNTPNLSRLFLHKTALASLEVNDHTKIERLWVSNCPNLTYLNSRGNDLLNDLRVKGSSALEIITCNGSKFQSIDLSGCTNLKSIDCSSNTSLTSLDLGNHTLLVFVNANGCTSLATLNLSNTPNLSRLFLSATALARLDVSDHSKIERLTVVNCPNLTYLNCSGNKLTNNDFEVQRSTALGELICYSNQLTTLDLSTNTGLTTLVAWPNSLTEIKKKTSATISYYLMDGDTQVEINPAEYGTTIINVD